MRRARGAALKQVRNAAGLSARKLVERVNARTGGSDITEHAIYAYESGRVQLSREVAERVAEVLRVPLGGLLVGDPDFAEPALDPPPGTSAGPAPTGSAHAAAPTGPPEAGRWAATRSSLLARCREAEPAADVLLRQLGTRRLRLPDPLIFTASFELLDADLSALIDSPEAAWLACREADAWHEPLRELIAAAERLRDAAMGAWGDLQAAAGPGGRGAAAACPAAARAIDEALGELRDQAGRVRGMIADAAA